MTIYLIFSDETGQYDKNRSVKYCHINPFYIRSALIIEADCWNELNSICYQLKEQYEFSFEEEIKWSYIWSLDNHRKRQEEIPQDKPYYFLRDSSTKKIINYIGELLEQVLEFDMKLIFTVTLNDPDVTPAISEYKMYKMHMQDIMQRIEMEVQSRKDNLALFFYDNISNKVERYIREAYAEIAREGDIIEDYIHIKDSISFEYSHHSIGLQISDLCAGIFHGMLKGYPNSIWLFNKYILPTIRKSPSGNPMGYGIVLVPNSEEKRAFIISKIQNAEKRISF